MPHAISYNHNSIIKKASAIPIVDHSGNGLRFGNGQDAQIPYNAGYNFGAQSNFAIHITVYPVALSGINPRIAYFSRRTATSTHGWELLSPSSTIFQLAMFASAGGRFSARAATISNIFNRKLNVTAVKYNSNPAVSVSSSEWYFWINGQLVPSSINTDTLLPSDTTTHTEQPFINRVGSISGTTGTFTYHKLLILNTVPTDDELRFIHKFDGILPESLRASRVIEHQFNQRSGSPVDSGPLGLNMTLGGFTAPETTVGASNKWLTKNQITISS